MSADILGTSWDQCISMVQYCFTSTETIRLVRTDSPGRPPQLSHSSWTVIYDGMGLAQKGHFVHQRKCHKGTWHGYMENGNDKGYGANSLEINRKFCAHEPWPRTNYQGASRLTLHTPFFGPVNFHYFVSSVSCAWFMLAMFIIVWYSLCWCLLILWWCKLCLNAVCTSVCVHVVWRVRQHFSWKLGRGVHCDLPMYEICEAVIIWYLILLV